MPRPATSISSIPQTPNRFGKQWNSSIRSLQMFQLSLMMKICMILTWIRQIFWTLAFFSSCSNELVPPLVPVNTTHNHEFPPPPVIFLVGRIVTSTWHHQGQWSGWRMLLLLQLPLWQNCLICQLIVDVSPWLEIIIGCAHTQEARSTQSKWT